MTIHQISCENLKVRMAMRYENAKIMSGDHGDISSVIYRIFMHYFLAGINITILIVSLLLFSVPIISTLVAEEKNLDDIAAIVPVAGHQAGNDVVNIALFDVFGKRREVCFVMGIGNLDKGNIIKSEMENANAPDKFYKITLAPSGQKIVMEWMKNVMVSGFCCLNIKGEVVAKSVRIFGREEIRDEIAVAAIDTGE